MSVLRGPYKITVPHSGHLPKKHNSLNLLCCDNFSQYTTN